MRISGWGRGAIAGVLAIGGLTAAAPVLHAVGRIEPGLWQMKTIGGDTAPRAVCIGDAMTLIQYGHGNGGCQRSIVTNADDIATVNYVCPGAGHGQTSIKVATPRSFNLETQGILGGAPFDESYEARRLGSCAPGH